MEYNFKHENNQRAALRYLAKKTYQRKRREWIEVRIKISIFFFSLALAAILYYWNNTFGG